MCENFFKRFPVSSSKAEMANFYILDTQLKQTLNRPKNRPKMDLKWVLKGPKIDLKGPKMDLR